MNHLVVAAVLCLRSRPGGNTHQHVTAQRHRTQHRTQHSTAAPAADRLSKASTHACHAGRHHDLPVAGDFNWVLPPNCPEIVCTLTCYHLVCIHPVQLIQKCQDLQCAEGGQHVAVVAGTGPKPTILWVVAREHLAGGRRIGRC
jgi:hypothetical protein